MEEQRKRDQKVHEFHSQDHSEIYRKINTIVVEWGEDSIYDQEMLTMLFEGYGPIKIIEVNEEKRKGKLFNPLMKGTI